MTLRDDDNPWNTIYSIIYEWLAEGRLTYIHDCEPDWCDLDITLFSMWGLLNVPPDTRFDYFSGDLRTITDIRAAFTRMIRNGDLDFDWITGPHALTLFKAKLLQSSPEVQYLFGLNKEACQSK